MRTGGLLLSLLLGLPALAGAAETTLVDFEIEDQFKRTHRDEDYAGRVVLVLAADRKGGASCGAWGQPIHAQLEIGEKARVGFLSVARTSGVPFFLKGTVRDKFPREKENWLLLDWKAKFHKSYDLAPDTCNALVFDAEGSLVHRAHGNEPAAADTDAVVQAIREALPGETTE